MAELLNTDFSEETLDSHITLNQEQNVFGYQWWTDGGASLDTVNDKLILNAKVSGDYSGSALISGYDLTGGFNLSFNAYSHSDFWYIYFNIKNSTNYWFIQWTNGWIKVFHVINGVGGNDGQQLAAYHQDQSIFNDLCELDIYNGILTFNYGTTDCFSDVTFNDSLTDSRILFIDGLTNNLANATIDNLVLSNYATLAPVASFTEDVTIGSIPLTVQFTDTSTNIPTSWLWDFGDENTSTDQNPEHIYEEYGYYTVSLTATNAAGSDEVVATNLINVTPYILLDPNSLYFLDTDEVELSLIDFQDVYRGSSTQTTTINAVNTFETTKSVTISLSESSPPVGKAIDTIGSILLSSDEETWDNTLTFNIDSFGVTTFYIKYNPSSTALTGLKTCNITITDGTISKTIPINMNVLYKPVELPGLPDQGIQINITVGGHVV